MDVYKDLCGLILIRWVCLKLCCRTSEVDIIIVQYTVYCYSRFDAGVIKFITPVSTFVPAALSSSSLIISEEKIDK